MAADYKTWTSRPLNALERRLLRDVYAAWAIRRPLDRGGVLRALRAHGAATEEAVQALESVAGAARSAHTARAPEAHPALVRELNRALVPRLGAAVALADDATVGDDLAELERVVTHLHEASALRGRVITIDQAVRALDIDRDRFDKLIELGELKRSNGETELTAALLEWNTYEDFLSARLPRAAPTVSEPPSIAVSALVHQVRWLGVGPFRASTTLQLSPLTVLVGANGAGKTSALAALSLLRSISIGGLHGVEAQRARLHHDADELMIGAATELTRRNAFLSEFVDWTLIAGTRGRVHARSEGLYRVRPRPGEHAPSDLATFVHGIGQWRDAEGLSKTHMMRPDELALTTASSPFAHPELIALRQSMMRWRVELVTRGLSAREATSVDEQSAELWQAYRAHPEAFDALRDHARMVAGVRGLTLRDNDELVIEDATGTPVEAHFASAGVVRAIEILAWLFAPQPPPLLAIDEIENHLHGDLAARLVDVMRSVSHRTRIVVTTHSAQVLRLFDVGDVRLVRNGPRGSTIIPVEDDLRLRRLAHTADIGDLLQDGYFGGAV